MESEEEREAAGESGSELDLERLRQAPYTAPPSSGGGRRPGAAVVVAAATCLAMGLSFFAGRGAFAPHASPPTVQEEAPVPAQAPMPLPAPLSPPAASPPLAAAPTVAASERAATPVRKEAAKPIHIYATGASGVVDVYVDGHIVGRVRLTPAGFTFSIPPGRGHVMFGIKRSDGPLGAAACSGEICGWSTSAADGPPQIYHYPLDSEVGGWATWFNGPAPR